MNRTLLAAGIVALGCGLISAPQQTSAQVTKQGNAYKMGLDLKKGAVYKYKLNVTADASAMMGPSGKKSYASPIILKVTDVKNGLATVQVTKTPPSFGSTPAKPETSTIKIDRTGKVTTGDEAGVVASLPTKPVKIGESWTTTSSTNSMGMNMSVTSKSTLKEVKTVGGRQVAVISVTTTSGGGPVKGTGSGTYTVDTKDGMMLNYDLKTVLTVTMAAAPPAAGSGKAPVKPAKPMTMPTVMKLVRQ